MEKKSRSLVKAMSWRVTGTLDTMIVSFIVTRKVSLALSIGFIELFTKVLLFYFHERLWNRISFGRIEKVPPEYEI